MADLISRVAAVECAIDAVDDWDGGWNPNRETVIRKYFAEVPAVDVMPVVYAKWEDCKDEHQCSACKEIVCVDSHAWKDIQFDFCPYCGARMDGERRDGDEAN